MEWIDESIDNYENVGWEAWNNVNKELLEAIDKWKWAELKQLLEWYSSMIKHLEEFDYLVKNVNYYDETLSELIKFSKTQFMEETVWRVSDNGNKEYCWAHLRNLLSPFKNMISLIKDFSKGDIEADTFKYFIKEFWWNFEENKKLFLKFSEFLEGNIS